MNIVNKLYDWGARRETLSVQPSYKNIQTLRKMCDEAGDALVDINRRIYALAHTVEDEYAYNQLLQILKVHDEQAYQLLVEREDELT